MKITQLKMLLDIANTGSFAKVSDKYQMNPSSVSRSISALETELGFKLFHRTTRKLRLTESGEVYLGKISSVIEQLELAKQKANDITNNLKGELRVTLPFDYSEFIIIPLIPKFKALYPDLKLTLLITDECLDLEARKIDVGVRLGKVTNEDWVVKSLPNLKLMLCASPELINSKRINSISDLTELPCLHFTPTHHNHVIWYFKDKKQNKRHLKLNNVLIATNALSVKSLCEMGQGVAILPEIIANPAIENKTLVKLFPEQEVFLSDDEKGVWCVYPYKDYIPKKTRVFVDFLTTELTKTK